MRSTILAAGLIAAGCGPGAAPPGTSPPKTPPALAVTLTVVKMPELLAAIEYQKGKIVVLDMWATY